MSKSDFWQIMIQVQVAGAIIMSKLESMDPEGSDTWIAIWRVVAFVGVAYLLLS
jgi:hypothetical protein